MLTLEDRLEILDLYARYNHFADFGESQRWADLFTPDAVFCPGRGAEAVCGRENLLALTRASHGKYEAEGLALRHVATNVAINATPYGAQGMAYLIVYLVGDGQPMRMLVTGRYQDGLVKCPDGWRFRSRAVTIDPSPPALT